METQALNLIYTLKQIAEQEFSSSSIMGAMGVLDKLNNYLLREGIKDIPKNVGDFYAFLYNRPVNSYIKGLNDIEAFITKYGEINPVVREVIGEDDIEEEIQRRTMGELLRLCRDKQEDEEDEYDWELIYKEARVFISQHYLIEKLELDKYLSHHFPHQVADFIKRMYEPENQMIIKYKVCAICGKPIKEIDNPEQLCSNPVCNYYISAENIKPIEKEVQSKLVKLHDGIYRYILSPSIGELKLYHRLCERFRVCEVRLYPNVDEYDTSISNYAATVYIDVKDTARPSRLVKLLKEESNLGKLLSANNPNVFVVIPDHRVKIYREQEGMKYMQELANLLENEKIGIRVIQERYLMSKIEEALKL